VRAKKQIPNTSPLLFELMDKCKNPSEKPEFKWLTEQTIKIRDWIFVGISERGEETWVNPKTKQVIDSNMN